MRKMSADEIRESFLKFFESKEHLRLPSYSLVPVDDPTLLIINAGMAPMKPYFKGESTPPRKRVATCQKCVRVGDIEQVGRTSRHLTFFEMLGNFSFGEYFKREAIRWAWEFVTEILGLPKDKLYATIHTDDDEAEQLWIEETGIPKNRIYRLPDNFWGPVGNTGPCGPCSEIMVDQGPEFGCNDEKCAPGCDCDRYLEVWNLVFTGLNKNEQGEYDKLPKPCIDTGAGFERLTAYLQGKKSPFDTELFEPVINKISAITGKTYGQEKHNDVSFRIISDHVRAVTFMASDGITPSNEGRGYVMRRLIRRSVRIGEDLGFGDRSLVELVDPIIERFGSIYPELREKADFVKSIISSEENSFRRTLRQGLILLENKLNKLEIKGEKTLSGTDMFQLYDTYGFPYELTEELAGEKGFTIDRTGFEKELEKQRIRARSDTHAKIGSLVDELDFTKYPSTFIGYCHPRDKTQVVAVFKDGKPADRVYNGEEADIIFSKTCFYGESGGQVGDTGKFKSESAEGVILDTRSTPARVNLHHVRIDSGDLAPGDTVEIEIDLERRKAIKRHHSATHLLQSALRTVLGTHIGQMGSLVDENKLRFDFSHHKAVTEMELTRIEELVNTWILENFTIEVREMPVNEALKSGAMAFFGEKYGDKVRVVSVPDISSELCGGTHVERTGDIGLFKIVSESSVATGVRRIEAVCGLVALKVFREEDEILRKAASMLNTDPYEVPVGLARIWSNVKTLEKELRAAKSDLMKASISEFVTQAQKVDDIYIIARYVENLEMDDLRALSDLIANNVENGIVVLGTIVEDKVSIIVRLTNSMVKKNMSAVPLVKEIASIVGGGGGGTPRMAQAGGRNPEKLDEAINSAFNIIKKYIEEQRVKK
jgi:alanyl-tRNA synthetase